MPLYGVISAIGNGAAALTTVGVMVTRAVPGRAGAANAFVISGHSLGQLVMIAILAAVLAQIGWRSVFVWLAVAHAVLIPILLLTLPAATHAHATQAPPAGANLREAARTPRFWLLLAIYAICGLGGYGGALIFDATGSYAAAFVIALALTVVALFLTLALPRASGRSTP